eukprot:TRINITY_DN25691_c0_g3_i4.p2 TRINITY_DN25691_c0_g3~~TRINITY_DN25691_c0_g3_i4.p2  ORF type:complete len:220 (+),score=16.49 TRINITY_DN25691_c0_g3_i4:95-661(+)
MTTTKQLKSNSQIVKKLQQELQKQAQKETKLKYEKYFKQQIKYRGLKAPETDAVLANSLKLLPQDNKQLIKLGIQLLQQEFAEDKLLGNRILKRGVSSGIFKSQQLHWSEFLCEIENLFEEGHVYEWGTCDSLCGHALSTLMKELQGEDRTKCAKYEIAEYLRLVLKQKYLEITSIRSFLCFSRTTRR